MEIALQQDAKEEHTCREQAMEISGSTSNSSTTQPVSAGSAATASSSSTKFDQIMKDLLPGEGTSEVSEEDLYSALLIERIAVHSSDAAAVQFQDAFDSAKSALVKKDGFIPMEDAANQALQAVTDAGIISSEVAAKCKSEAFSAAQLDDNLTALWDNRGGVGDPTIATSTLEAALLSARTKLAGVESPTTSTDDPSTSATDDTPSETEQEFVPSGQAIDGDGGFVFKPIADVTGNLMVLLPSLWDEETQSVTLKDKDGNEIEKGKLSTVGSDGRRSYQFSKPGASYGKEVVVEVKGTNGETTDYQIPDPSLRYD